MTLEGVFLELRDRLRHLSAQVDAVGRLAQDTPNDQEHFLAGQIGDAARDAVGWLREARKAVRKARRVLKGEGDIEKARQALAQCQHTLDRLKKGTARELRGRRRLADLKDLANRRSETWGAWAGVLAASLRELRKPFADVEKAAVRCWQELAGRLTNGRVVIQNTSVGQQIVGRRGRK